ncbi:glycosyltransferase family 2 protein [Beijerinckia mobilis]|uniref:glycosyltransferase family 2 protein n=1 Tax=Beijerinckia mobilis TaxID=231434 RepID=UPI00054E5A64|nr:glycosyltransferase family 2 protein [Beijerinckia mobilis]
MRNVAVVVLTYNEEMHLARALESVAPFAKEVFVIDSGSTDQTIAIAKARGARVLYNPFVSQAKQFQWGLDNAPITAEWVMRLDADEIIEPDLAAEIEEKLPKLASDVTGINLKRKHIFLGRWVRHGGRYPLLLLRIWRHGLGRVEDRWMDEHILVTKGRTIAFDGGFADWNLNDMSYFTAKHNRYATREAVEIINQRRNLFLHSENAMTGKNSTQALLKRCIKERIYNHIPFPISATGYFLLRYIFQLGFLDGVEGLSYHFLQGYWYRFLVGVKVLEFERAIAPFKSVDEQRAALARVSGLDL